MHRKKLANSDSFHMNLPMKECPKWEEENELRLPCLVPACTVTVSNLKVLSDIAGLTDFNLITLS